MEHCKKLSSWDIYGVTKFPYRGKRKYSPGVQRSFYGIITITNDVFGLTIFQFEREFKACLARRKKTQQRIQDIRYPDKTSCRYLDYLKYGDDTVEGFRPALELQRSGINLNDEARMYYNLIQVAGTEFEIRTRQRIFVVKDKIMNRTRDDGRLFSSGSRADGIYFPESDIDIMFEYLAIEVLGDVKQVTKSRGQTTLLMEFDARYPGFCKLKLVAEGFHANEFIRNCLKDTESGIYVSTEKVLHLLGNKFNEGCTKCLSHSRHGPCISDVNQEFDFAFCLRSKSWPSNAMPWIYRHRVGQWPTGNVIDTIVNDGCLFVPIGPKNEDSNELLWRMSFSLAEKRLTHSMNYTQLLCYTLLKLTLKNIINRYEDVKGLLCSYFLKTTVFWILEETCLESFNLSRISDCFSLCLEKLLSFVKNCYCPNYFVPHHNMFIGKIDESNNKSLLEILYNLKTIGLQFIIDRLLDNRVIRDHLWSSLADTSKVFENLDLIFLQTLCSFRHRDIFKEGATMIQYIHFLMEAESSGPVMHILRTCHGMTNQEMSQSFMLQTQRCRLTNYRRKHRLHYNSIKSCKKHLVDGTKTDAVSGWLLYASFYYVLGHYNTTLQIVDFVLPRCIKFDKDVSEQQNEYKHAKGSHFIEDKMRYEELTNVRYARQSTLIPQELQPEIQDRILFVAPVVMSQCLQFLCYHHLGDVNSKHRILRELHSTVTCYKMLGIYVSNALVILGVCFELSGDKNTAYNCYSEALRQEEYVCQSAKQRIENILSNSDA